MTNVFVPIFSSTVAVVGASAAAAAGRLWLLGRISAAAAAADEQLEIRDLGDRIFGH